MLGFSRLMFAAVWSISSLVGWLNTILALAKRTFRIARFMAFVVFWEPVPPDIVKMIWNAEQSSGNLVSSIESLFRAVR